MRLGGRPNPEGRAAALPTRTAGPGISSPASRVRQAARQAETRLADADVVAAITVFLERRRGLARSASDVIARDCPLIAGPGRPLKPATDAIDAAFGRDAKGDVAMGIIEMVSRRLDAGTNSWTT